MRSIKEELLFSLEADSSVSRKNELPENLIFLENGHILLKTAILYGRNASGKSNILAALAKLQKIVRESDSYKVEEKISVYEPFQFEEESAKAPTRIEILFVTENEELKLKVKYEYIIEFNYNKIIYESLSFYPKGQIAKLFERKEDAPISYGDYLKGNKKAIEDGLLENQLFLSKSASYKLDHLKEPYLYITSKIFTFIVHNTNFEESILKVIISKLENPDFKRNLLELLKAGDTGIVDIFQEKSLGKIYTSHRFFQKENEKDISRFDLNLESLGTQKLFIIGGILLLNLGHGYSIIIDELDKSLHPHLTKMLIRLFHSKENNPSNSQLIFTTHDSSLMNGELFRRDQMFITEKDYMGNTTVYNLSSIKGVRKNIPFEKWYLGGSFGGIPVVYEPELVYNGESK